MIRVFGQTDKTFLSNGDVVLSPLKAKVHKKDNGDYFLDLETGLEYVDFFVEGNIVVANTPTGDQAFRIGDVTKSKSKLVSKCWHVFYDSRNYLIADSNVVNKNCNDALIHLNNATEPTSEFSVMSDVSTVDSFRCVRQSLFEAVQTVIERWGGHLVRDNFSISVRDSIGTDNGIIIQYKKNLKDITCQEVWDDVVTKILPVGKDGILLNAVNPSADIYITSSTQYALPYTKTVAFTQDNINQEDYTSETAYKTALVNDLRAQATAYLATNCVPQINYTLKANLDRVTDIGDTIEVIDERLGVNLMTHVIGFEYDCISQQYTEVEFGNFMPTLAGFANTINANLERTAAQTQSVQDSIIGIMSKSYVIYDGSQILVVDTLPKENATNVIKIDNQGIGFSQNGINGTYTSKWDIDGSMTLGGSLTIGENALEDFIVEADSSNDWIWEKYASGKVEAWAQIEVDSSQVTWATLTTDFESTSVDVAYPFTIDNAVITATVNSSSATAWILAAEAYEAQTAEEENKAVIQIARKGDTQTILVNIHVKGIEGQE